MINRNENSISRLTLGTAQFGLAYGIANQAGKPAYETCREIMAEAYAAGIRCFDTAAAYGESESVLGKALAELAITDSVTLISKCRPLDPAIDDPEVVRLRINTLLENSLKNLGVEQLPVYMFHRDVDLRWISILADLQERGLIARIGVSVETPNGAEAAANEPLVEALQLPHNLFDHRFSKGSWFKDKAGKRLLFARSAFLQGLMLMPEERIPEGLNAVIPVRRQVEKIAADAGMGMAELCLRYSLSFPSIDSVLIGVDSVQQLKQNTAMAARGPLSTEVVERINSVVPDFPDSIVRPSLWPK